MKPKIVDYIIRNRQKINVTLHRKCAYFSVVEKNGRILLFFRATAGAHSKTAVAESLDGVSFTPSKIILKNSYACHNFYAFLDAEKVVHALGGMYVPDGAFPQNDGLSQFRMVNDLSPRRPKLIIRHDHPGYFNAVTKWGKLTEIDGHISCIYDEKRKIYVLFLRYNPAAGSRSIQRSSATRLGRFGPFSPIAINDSDVKIDNYYAPTISMIDGMYVGFIPYVTEEYCSIRVIRSPNGKRWSIAGDLFPSQPRIDSNGAPKNRDHAVGGLIVRDSSVWLYIHHNYLGNVAEADVTIVRYELSGWRFSS